MLGLVREYPSGSSERIQISIEISLEVPEQADGNQAVNLASKGLDRVGSLLPRRLREAYYEGRGYLELVSGGDEDGGCFTTTIVVSCVSIE
jgi:hypothetical protein